MCCRKLTHFLSIFRRRKTGILLKAFTKIIPVIISYLGGDIRNSESGIRKQLLCLFHSIFGQILIQGFAGFIFEKGTYIGGRQKHMIADILDG